MSLFSTKCSACGTSDKSVAKHQSGRALCERCAIEFNEKALQHSARLAKIVVCTGDLKRSYDIVEVVMTLQGHPQWTSAWMLTLDALRTDALRLGCDAIVCLQVEHRVYLHQHNSFWGQQNMQAVEFFAYGTAVKFRDTTS